MAQEQMNLEQKLKTYRLNRGEYDQICKLLGRAPEGVEWALFSALWSEHCSYKSSRFHLKKFFSRNERVVTAHGENAGVVDLGEGEMVAFKMESHNHPSFIEPYEGAATGVGGILRDIFTMGARPVMLANYLCFGEMSAPRMTMLVNGVVRGIGGYGNCVGVPTVSGQTEFHKSYNQNILVNAMAVGLFRPGDPMMTATAKGTGNLVVYVGAKTGRDGIHGASMASESFDKNSESKKPTIQKGDPFFEKLLIESCLEVMKSGHVIAIQDMGAAGLTSSSFEMAAKGGVGFDIHLDQVPLRDDTMMPEEILLSESQERMLLICEPHKLVPIQSVFSKWDLDAVAIGTVTDGPEVNLFWHKEKIAGLDPKLLTDQAPLYQRPYQPWKAVQAVDEVKGPGLKGSQLAKELLEKLDGYKGNSRRWIFEQYDQRVGAKTALDASQPVSAIRLPDTGRGLGMVLGCRPYVMRMDAFVGGADAVAYPALELASKGFLPLAVTDCLNFGNPENPHIMSQFVAAVESMSAQCEAMNTPVISGNVSFYNETLGENITSTPATGLVGLRHDVQNLPRSEFAKLGDEVFVLAYEALRFEGLAADESKGSSHFAGKWDAGKMAEFIGMTRQLAAVKGVQATRVVGKYGMPYTLARMCLGGMGAEISEAVRMDFTETMYEVIFVLAPEQSFEFRRLYENLAKQSDLGAQLKLQRLGTVKSDTFTYGDMKIPVGDLQKAYFKNWGDQIGIS